MFSALAYAFPIVVVYPLFISNCISTLVLVSECLSACLPACLSVCLSVHLSIYLSIHRSVYLSIDLSIYPSTYLSTHRSIYIKNLSLSTYLSSLLSISQCMGIHLCVYKLYMYTTLSLSLYLSISISTYLCSLSLSLSLYLFVSVCVCPFVLVTVCLPRTYVSKFVFVERPAYYSPAYLPTYLSTDPPVIVQNRASTTPFRFSLLLQVRIVYCGRTKG